MTIIHIVNRSHVLFLPRLLTAIVEETLRQFPVVVLTGARQTGKSTLVQHLPSAGTRRYLTLDDLDLQARARHAHLTLLPMTEREKRGAPEPGPWGRLLAAESTRELARGLERQAHPAADWTERALIGGYPPVVLAGSAQERTRWDRKSTRLKSRHRQN